MKRFLLALCALTVLGCAPTPMNVRPTFVLGIQRGDVGSLNVSVRSRISNYELLATASQVEKVVITVTGAALSEPLVAEFDRTAIDAGISASWHDMPTGDVTVTAQAYKLNDKLVGSDSETVTIVEAENTAVQLVILLNGDTGRLGVGVTLEDSKPVRD